jgi:hypothetical protein
MICTPSIFSSTDDGRGSSLLNRVLCVAPRLMIAAARSGASPSESLRCGRVCSSDDPYGLLIVPNNALTTTFSPLSTRLIFGRTIRIRTQLAIPIDEIDRKKTCRRNVGLSERASRTVLARACHVPKHPDAFSDFEQLRALIWTQRIGWC